MPASPSLERFVEAQEGVYPAALGELRRGRKASHWMWFVFPQLDGLGRSPTARHFGIAGIDEAKAYMDHPVLGPRLIECARALLDLETTDPVAIFGAIDAMKLRSSMTLFAHAAPDEPAFPAVLAKYYGGGEDDATLSLLGRH
jgi:uncharacterized protein (DUF1810 family)